MRIFVEASALVPDEMSLTARATRDLAGLLDGRVPPCSADDPGAGAPTSLGYRFDP